MLSDDVDLHLRSAGTENTVEGLLGARGQALGGLNLPRVGRGGGGWRCRHDDNEREAPHYLERYIIKTI
jgi:hypothetical protein